VASFLHDGLLELFRNRPRLAPELLRDAFHEEVPPFEAVRVSDANVTVLVPAEFRTDLVLVLEGGDGTPQGAVVVEAQLAPKDEKRWSWPAYLASLRSRLRCGVVLLVITLSDSMAKWAAKPIAMGHPEWVLTPLVLGPASVPVVLDEALATLAPELAVLSVVVHKHQPEVVQIARTAMAGARGLDPERAALYLDLIFASVPETARATLEALMASGTYQYQSDFAKRYVAQGEAIGRAHAILSVLGARGLAVSDQERQRILECSDLAVLEKWIVRAVTAKSAADVLGE
jgi:hypothetical protein